MYIYLYIFAIHFFVINVLEKLYINQYYDNVYRPMETCQGSGSIRCLGMPSGHSETIAVLTILLYLNGHIGAFLAMILIGLVGSQRILSGMHTLGQVVAGVTVGVLYALLYYSLGSSFYVIVVSILIALVFILLILVAVDKKVQGPIPRWVDPALYPVIEKKRNHNIWMKATHVLFLYISHKQDLFISWNKLERELDKIAEAFKGREDVVVGLKSGGAILANYLGKTMDLPYHFIKISSNCDSSTLVDSFKDLLKRVNMKHIPGFKVCEGISESLSGKRVLLVDEQIATGTSVVTSREYLLKEKGVASVQIATLSKSDYSHMDVFLPQDRQYLVFPWGYDN